MSRRLQSPVDELTPRERDVARLMARGLTNPQIAESLGIGFGTAKTHVSQVIAKLGAANREDATDVWRREHGFSRRLHRSIAGLLPALGWKTAAIAGVAGVAAIVLPLAALLVAKTGGESSAEPDPVPASFANQWEPLPNPPITPRVHVASVWTGTELLLVGGDTLACAPTWRCPMTAENLPTDAAALDPDAGTWRAIADAPFGFSAASAAFVGDSAYFLARNPEDAVDESTLLRYSLSDDDWSEVVTPGSLGGTRALSSAHGALLVYRLNGQTDEPDYLYDPMAESWTAIPPDPFASGFDREMRWLDGSIYLLDYAPENGSVPVPPMTVRLARYDPVTADWQVLPSTVAFNLRETFAGDGQLVNPSNAYDQPTPAIFDATSGEWLDLPPMPEPQGAGGVLGQDSGAITSPAGLFFDAVSESWVSVPKLEITWPDSIDRSQMLQVSRNFQMAGTDIVQYGGLVWSDSQAKQVDETWILRFHRPPANEPGPAAFADHWERLPDPPIEPRVTVVSVWTGEEAIFVGGDDYLCPPLASCPYPGGAHFKDGAAYNPATNAWRTIADAPFAIPYASTAVVGNSVFFRVLGAYLGEPGDRLLRYDIESDAWTEIDLPDGGVGKELVAADGRLVVYAEGASEFVPDYVYDDQTDTWALLPPNSERGGGRQMVWYEGYLYLSYTTGLELPPLARLARFSFATGVWEQQADSEVLRTGPWLADDSRLVEPFPGGEDGGEINNWGRQYPNGGIFNIKTNSWSSLPDPPDEGFSAGAIGTGSAMFLSTDGWLLDLTTDSWLQMPPLDAEDSGAAPSAIYVRRDVLTAGTDAIAFGGERWAGTDAGTVLNEAWIWRSGR